MRNAPIARIVMTLLAGASLNGGCARSGKSTLEYTPLRVTGGWVQKHLGLNTYSYNLKYSGPPVIASLWWELRRGDEIERTPVASTSIYDQETCGGVSDRSEYVCATFSWPDRSADGKTMWFVATIGTGSAKHATRIASPDAVPFDGPSDAPSTAPGENHRIRTLAFRAREKPVLPKQYDEYGFLIPPPLGKTELTATLYFRLDTCRVTSRPIGSGVQYTATPIIAAASRLAEE